MMTEKMNGKRINASDAITVITGIIIALPLALRFYKKLLSFEKLKLLANYIFCNIEILFAIISILLVAFIIVVYCRLVRRCKYIGKYKITEKTKYLVNVICILLSVFTNFGFTLNFYYDYAAQLFTDMNDYEKVGIVDLNRPEDVSYFDASVIQISDELYRMYVSDRGGSSIICFDSTDLEHWSSKKTCLGPGKDGEWDSTVNRATVTKINDKYIMYYTGQNDGHSYIGMAESDDGVVFSRIFSNPVLVPETDYEKDSVMNPYVIWNESTNCYYMYYAAGETYEPNVLCIAISDDGYSWEKLNKIILQSRSFPYLDSNRVGACEVYSTDDGYEMYYIGYSDIDTARIFYAKSKDGITWTRQYNNVIIAPSKTYDMDACYKPTVIRSSTVNYLWYNGRTGATEQIILAEKKTK